MSKTRLTSRRRDDGQYRLESMTQEEHEAFESELTRPDFTQAHGATTPAIFDDLWKRQQGLCCLCVGILDPATAFYEDSEGSGLHCETCSSVLTVRRFDNPDAYANDAHLRMDKMVTRNA